MTPHHPLFFRRTLTTALAALPLLLGPGRQLLAQDAEKPAPTVETAGTNAPAGSTNAAPSVAEGAPGTNAAAGAAGEKKPAGTNDEIQISFQGANIDMIVQWLAQTTGKSVVKHPQVQCQLTINSSKKLPTRQAIDLVYRALSLEGFSAVESASSIFIVPEGKEPKMNPEVISATQTNIPEGRQRLVKIFTLGHMQASEMREKIRGVLSDKGSIDTDERANQIIITDYNDNLRLMAELIKEFDTADSGMSLEIYPLKYADAEEVGNLIGLILSGQPGSPSSATSSSSSNRSSSSGRNSSLPPGFPMMMGGPSGDSGSSTPTPSGLAPQAPGQAVRIWPDRDANRLIVFAAKSRFAEIERLLAVLDTEKPEDVAVRVIPLKNVQAVDLVKEIQPIYQKMGGRSPKDSVEIAANDRSNSLIILASEANFKAIEKMVNSLDTEDAQEKVMKTFPLKNADAEDVARQLQDLNQDQNSSGSRYTYYFGYSPTGRSAHKLSVVADRRRNSVIVQAAPGQMDGIEKMIADLDEPVSDDSLAPRIYHLKYVSASDIEDVLNELFLKKTQQRSYFDFFSDFPSESEDHNVGRLYGKVRITSEPYSNTLIITSNSKESLNVLEEVLKQLDQPSEGGDSTLRISLKFAKASTVANSINILFAKNGSPLLHQQNPQNPQQQNPQQQNQQRNNSTSSESGFNLEEETKEEGYFPWLGGQPDNPRGTDGRSPSRPVSDLVGRVRAVADPRSNALLISANVHFFPQVLKLVEDLDAPTDQVLIEARLVEVSSDFLDKLGVRWSPNGSQVFSGDDYDNSLLAHGSGTYAQGVGGNTTVNTPISPFSTGSTIANPIQTLASLRSGVLGGSVNMDFLIQFLKRNTDARVLAEPQLNIRDNEIGRLFVGQQVPVLTAQNNPALGGTSQNFEYKNVGVILEVTPHINKAGDVELRIHAESSTVVPGETILNGAVFDTRTFRTDLTAHNGQTLVLGGIIQRQVTETLRKTPILGDIPGLGWAFKKKDKTSHEVELMVFMRPKVTHNAAEDSDLLKDIYQKAPHIRDWNENKPLDHDRKSKDKGKDNAPG